MKLLVFDIYAPYAHFRVPYTTSSPLTYPFPPKTSIYGMISALIGLNKNKYLEYFQNNSCKVAIGIQNPIKKTAITENFIDVKKVDRKKFYARIPYGKSSRTQIRLELIQDPCYRVFFYHKDEYLYNEVKRHLENHKSVYTLSMGLSELLANYTYMGEYEIENKINPDFVKISSIIPMENLVINNLKLIESEKKFLKVHTTTEFATDRTILKSADFLLECTGKSIGLKDYQYQHVKDMKESLENKEVNIILF
jgi:CRISPR-associated protein Cas5h